MNVLALILAGAMAAAAPHAHSMVSTHATHGKMKTKTTMHGKMHGSMHSAMHGTMNAHQPMTKPTKQP